MSKPRSATPEMMDDLRALAATRDHRLAPSMFSQALTLVSALATKRHLEGRPLRTGEFPVAPAPEPVVFRRPADDPSHEQDVRTAMADVAGRVPLISTFTDIPRGFYATDSRSGRNDLDFWKVDRPEEGKYEGRTFVRRVIGGRPDANLNNMQARLALVAIREAGPEAAALRYATELGQCSECNRSLTDEESRRVGKGPYCRNK